MLGIVIVTHGDLGESLIKSASMIFGEITTPVHAVSIASISMEAEPFRQNLLTAIDHANAGDGVLVLTDLFGGTPSNLAISALSLKNIEIIAGVNLPMVLKALTLSNPQYPVSLAEASTLVEEAGKKQISIVSQLIRPASPHITHD